MRRWLRDVEVVGAEHLHGPNLVLMNHGSAFDPFLLTLYGGRAMHFMVTEPAMDASLRGRMLAWLGQVPKRKLEADTRAVRTLKKWVQLGATVCVFPEGMFSWDGQLGPIMPGLAQLVDYLEAPVVTVRQIGSHRLWPAWARHPRRTTVRLEVDPPVRFGPDDDIEAEVARRLKVHPAVIPAFRTTGSRLALGLVRHLRFCPCCGAEGTLEERGDQLGCQTCWSRWTVDVDNVLHRVEEPDEPWFSSVSEETPNLREIGVHDALLHNLARLEAGWKNGISLASRGPVEVLDISRSAWESLVTAPLSLTGTSLSVASWTLDLGQVLGVTLDWGDLVILRTQHQRLALRMPHDSRALFHAAIERARGESPREPHLPPAGPTMRPSRRTPRASPRPSSAGRAGR